MDDLKLHVANVEKGSDEELALFEEYGTVTECAVAIHVQISKSHRGGYWPPRYPGERHEPPPPSYLRGRLSHIPQVTQPLLCRPLPPRRAVYPDRPYEGERDRYGVVDYYEKYRARPYGMASYEDQRAGVPSSPSPSAVVRDRLMTSSLDPYDRRPLPPPPSSYYARDRSPLRRAPSTPMPPASNGYSYERSRLSPVSRFICVICSSFRIVVRLRRRSPPPDARDTIHFLSAAERVKFP
uniref:RNA binding motif protein 4.3 n=1 Tax=Lates calcarifer TaxID=8187 RepID=A0A4W6D5G5_LATCA